MKTSNIILLSFFALIILSITIVLFIASYNLHYPSTQDQETTIDSAGQHITRHSYRQRNSFFSTVFREEVRSSGTAEQKLRLPQFNKMEVKGKFFVYYTQGRPQNVVIKADSSIINLAEIEVNDGKLSLRCKESLRSKQHIDVYITTDSIAEVESGVGAKFETVGKIKIHHFNGVAATGSIFMIDGDFSNLQLKLSTGCVGTFSGTSKDMDLQASTGCVINAGGLVAQRAHISCSTGTVANIDVAGELSVEASTGSVVNCKGNPVLKSKSISSGAQFHE
jgi:hypothetical protein